MSTTDPGLRRVSVHVGTAVIDLTLPAGVPVATLIPPIVDSLEGGAEGSGALTATRYQLSRIGAAAMDSSTTLAQNGIHDGALMVLSQVRAPLPAARYDDVADAVTATMQAAHPGSALAGRQSTRLTAAVAASYLAATGGVALVRTAFSANATQSLGGTAGISALAGVVALLFAVIAHRVYGDSIAGLALSVMATAFAAVAGFLAVPGPPSVANVLLAAMAAAAMSVLAMRGSGCGAQTLTAVSCFAILTAVAALVGELTDAPLHVIGSVSALVTLGLLGIAARVAIVLAGLSPQLTPAPDLDAADGLAAKAIRAGNWLTSLVSAFSAATTVGAVIGVLTGKTRLGGIAFGAGAGALLLLHARSIDRKRALMFVTGGTITIATTFGVAAIRAPGHGLWIAAVTAMLALAPVCVGFVAPSISFSPMLRRSVEVLECLVLAAMVPLTFWICGFYGAVRGLNPTWS